jgi:hypothetical protein
MMLKFSDIFIVLSVFKERFLLKLTHSLEELKHFGFDCLLVDTSEN